MTILSKKKPPNKSEENLEGALQNTHNHPGSLNSIQNYNQNRERQLDDCYSAGVTVQLDPLENDGGKRRVKSSPSRITRCNKLRERGNSSWQNSPAFVPEYSRSSSPKPGPSTAPDDFYEDHNTDEERNSEDEYDGGAKTTYTESEWMERDRIFEKRMGKCGLEIRKMKEDGACLFRSVSDQVYGDQEMHDVVRKHCMDYIAANRDYYSQYMTEDFNKYINRKRQGGTHGNHIEIQAMCEMYSRPIEVFCYSKDPINIFHGSRSSKNTNEPIRLSYQRDSHYNSIIDPFKATIGVGLGLPNYSPGSADRNLIKDAVLQSEQLEIEQTMLEDKLRATDWEATNEAIEEQVARESYLQWFKEAESRKKSMASKSPKETPVPTSTVSTAEGQKTEPDEVTEKRGETKDIRNKSPDAFQFDQNASFFDTFPPELFGLGEFDDYGILTQVLATSQEEYLQSLKRQQQQDKEDKA